MHAMTRRELLGSSLAGGAAGLLAGCASAGAKGAAPGAALAAVLASDPVRTVYRLTSINAHAQPKSPRAPSTFPTPDAFQRAVTRYVHALPNVPEIFADMLNSPNTAANEGKVAADYFWNQMQPRLETALSNAAPAGTTIRLVGPQYAINEMTGVHVKSGWAMAQLNGVQAPHEVPLVIKDERGGVAWSDPVYLAFSLTVVPV